MNLLSPLLFLMNSSFALASFVGTTIDLPAKNILNCAYKNDPSCTMDIYLPAGRNFNSTKVMIMVHGGGWSGGDKSEFNTYINTLHKKLPDYAFFNLNYRLVNQHHIFPAQEQDMQVAVQFIQNHAKEYQVNPEKIILLGASAGAHLALLEGYKNNNGAIKAVIDFFGPANLLSMYEHPWHPFVPLALQMVTGTTPDKNRELYQQSSPEFYISKSTPPTLIFHGTNDPVVDISQSRNLYKKLKAFSVKADLIEYQGERHGWHGNNLNDSFEKIARFLKLVIL